nr:MAG TPA: hypothetical protein [Caudoviricetes sp.]
MKYVVYECSYKNGKFYYIGETEVNKREGDFPRNVLDSIGINNIILNTITIDLNPGTLVGYLLDDYDGEIYIFEENEVPGYVIENLDGPRTIHLYKVDTDELISVGYCASIDEAEQMLVILHNTFDKLGMNNQIKCFCIPVDHSKPYRLVEVFNLMAPDEIKVTNVIHYDNVEDAENKKAELEYETSKYPGTDVNSYFVI